MEQSSSLPGRPMEDRGAGRLHLVVELVPEGCRFQSLRSELRPRDWERLGASIPSPAWRCRACAVAGRRYLVEPYDAWHYDDVAHVRRLVGMVVLCLACRRVCNLAPMDLEGPLDESPLAHLAEVNGWDEQRLVAHLEEALALWAERSRYRWHEDLSVLDGWGSVSPGIAVAALLSDTSSSTVWPGSLPQGAYRCTPR